MGEKLSYNAALTKASGPPHQPPGAQGSCDGPSELACTTARASGLLFLQKLVNRSGCPPNNSCGQFPEGAEGYRLFWLRSQKLGEYRGISVIVSMTENLCEAENIFKKAETLRNYSSETSNDFQKVFRVLIAGGVIVGCT